MFEPLSPSWGSLFPPVTPSPIRPASPPPTCRSHCAVRRAVRPSVPLSVRGVLSFECGCGCGCGVQLQRCRVYTAPCSATSTRHKSTAHTGLLRYRSSVGPWLTGLLCGQPGHYGQYGRSGRTGPIGRRRRRRRRCIKLF